MDSKLLDKFILFYFLIAQTTSAPILSIFNKKYMNWIPIVVHFIITNACIYQYLSEHVPFYDAITSMLPFLRILVLMPNILIFVSNVCANEKLQSIFKDLLNIKDSIENQFGAIFIGDKFMRNHIRKIFIFMFVFILNSIARAYLSSRYKFNNYADMAMYFFIDVFVLFFIFHIDLLRFLSDFLCTNLKQISKTQKMNDVQRENMLNYVCWVHRQMWNCKIQIEKRFGWILMIVIFRQFVMITGNLFYLFVLLAETKRSSPIRK